MGDVWCLHTHTFIYQAWLEVGTKMSKYHRACKSKLKDRTAAGRAEADKGNAVRLAFVYVALP